MKFLRHYGILLAILFLALALRGGILAYGLPLLLHEDEPIYLQKALGFGYGDFNPAYFKKPSFFLYFYFGFYYLYYLLGALAGSHPFSWSLFEAAFWKDPTTLTLIGRSISLIFSIASVWLIYRIGERVFSKPAGLGAAFLLAVHPTHVKISPIVISDIPALFFVLLTAWFALDVYRRGTWRDYLFCGAAIALTASFKYNVFVAAFLVAAHGLRSWSYQGWRSLVDRRLISALLLSAGLFFLLSPYTLINLDVFIREIAYEKSHMLERTLNIPGREAVVMVSFFKIFLKLIPRDIGWPLYIAGLLGAVGVLFQPFRNPKSDWQARLILLSFPILFLLVVSNFRLVNAKYLLPVTPCLFLLACHTLQEGLSHLFEKCRLKPSYAWGGYGVLLLLLFGFPLLVKSWKHVSNYRQPSTLTQAWLFFKHRPLDGLVFLEPETIPVWNKTILDHTSATGSFSYFRPSAEQLDSRKPQAVLMNPKPVRNEKDVKILRYDPAYYDYLARHYRIEEVFSPYSPATPVNSDNTDYLDLYNRLQQDAKNFPGPLLILLVSKP